jgi:hypothetical protein
MDEKGAPLRGAFFILPQQCGFSLLSPAFPLAAQAAVSYLPWWHGSRGCGKTRDFG